jgi:hypothetical protein
MLHFLEVRFDFYSGAITMAMMMMAPIAWLFRSCTVNTMG